MSLRSRGAAAVHKHLGIGRVSLVHQNKKCGRPKDLPRFVAIASSTKLLLFSRAFLFGCAGFWSSGFRGRLGRWGLLGSGRAARVNQI